MPSAAAPGSPLRVLWVIKGLGPGGAERLLLSVAQIADPAAVRYEVAHVLPWKQHLVPELEQAGVRTHLLGGSRGLADPRWIARLRRLVRRERFDVVHVHSPAVAAVVRPLLRTVRPRPLVVTTEHNVWTSHGRATRTANRLTHRFGDVHLSVSEEVARSMTAGLRPSSTVVVHGVDVDGLAARRAERAEARAELGLADDEVAVVSVANLRANKDHVTLLAAAASALDRAPALRFLAVGQGPLEEELHGRADALGLGSRFRFLGYQADPIRVLVAADVFTLSSRHEGLPIALLEAMAVGVPAVVTAVGGVPSVVTDDVDGIVVPAADPAALADAYVALAEDAPRRARLGAAGQARVAAFGIARAAREVEAHYAAAVTSAEGSTPGR